MNQEVITELINQALRAREYSYCPYSGYAVGAAVQTLSGKIYQGCNIENSSYGATNCAERTAIFKAVSEGEVSISAIAIVGGLKDSEITGYAYPCGICRQVMSEFATGDFKVIVAKSLSEYKIYSLDQLLPEAFLPSSIG